MKLFSKRAPDFVDRFFGLDLQLAARGFPNLSPWWRKVLTRFLRSSCRRLVLRVGRRGGKSSTLSRLAVAMALFGDWTVPPGDVALVAFLSTDRTEAAARLRTIAALLDALGAKYTRRADEIELHDRPVLFRVVTASVRAAVGFTCILAICDELARWRDAEQLSNPAKEILASLTPTLATVKGARLVCSSSPWTTSDHHAELFEQGETAFQQVAQAASWEANPTISEAETRALEPDPRVHLREYAAVPVASVTAVATAEEIAACTTHGKQPIPDERRCMYFLDVGLRNDSTALLRGWFEHRRRTDDPQGDQIDQVLVLDVVAHLTPTFLRPVLLEDVIRTVVAANRVCPGIVVSDGHYADAVGPRLREMRVTTREAPSTSSAITARVEVFQSRITARTIELPRHEALQREISQAQLVRHTGGRVTLRAPDRKGMHDDLLSCVLLACDPEVRPKIPVCAGADVVVAQEPVSWSPEEGLTGGQRRYFTRTPGGKLVPREPPFGSVDFDAYAEEMLAQGITTRAIERWKRERADGNERDTLNVPIRTL